jgi:hypothetical protein
MTILLNAEWSGLSGMTRPNKKAAEHAAAFHNLKTVKA